MTEKQIEYILAIDQFRSISKAAEQLGISQPYLSQYLSNLENELGCKLFDRSSYPINITPQGEAYIETAKEINGLQIDLKNKLAEIDNSFSGRLTIAVPSHIGFGVMPRVLKNFNKYYPKYHVTVMTDTLPDYPQAIKTGAIDFCISAREIDDASIASIATKSASLIVAAPKDYDIEDTSVASDGHLFPMADLEKLKKYPFIMVKSDGGLIRNSVLEAMKDFNVDEHTNIECDSYFLCTRLIDEGLGASVIPSTCIDLDSIPNSVRYYRLPVTREPKDINIFFRKRAYMSKASQDFINLIIQAIHTTP